MAIHSIGRLRLLLVIHCNSVRAYVPIVCRFRDRITIVLVENCNFHASFSVTPSDWPQRIHVGQLDGQLMSDRQTDEHESMSRGALT